MIPAGASCRRLFNLKGRTNAEQRLAACFSQRKASPTLPVAHTVLSLTLRHKILLSSLAITAGETSAGSSALKSQRDAQQTRRTRALFQRCTRVSRAAQAGAASVGDRSDDVRCRLSKKDLDGVSMAQKLCGAFLRVAFLLFVAVLYSASEAFFPCPDMKRAGRLLSSSRIVARRPSQLRLSISDYPEQMTLSWVLPAQGLSSYVEFGQHRKRLRHKSNVTSERTYGANKSGLRAKVFCSAVMTGLNASTRYYYRVVVADGSASDVYSFLSRPEQKSEPSPVSWLFLADHGTKTNSFQTFHAMMRYRENTAVQLALHGGDISYGNGKDYIWDKWGLMMEPLTAALPYMVAPGNHEIIPADSGQENGLPLQHRFSMPYWSSGSHSPFWYSFHWGLVHFVAISSEHAHSVEQQVWLKDTLYRANRQRSRRPWIVTFAHSPIYTSNTRHGNNTELRAWLDPLLEHYSVDLCLWGHDHAYERLYPLQQGNVTASHYHNITGTVHITCGSSGWDLHNCWDFDAEMSAFRNAGIWGFCHAVAHNASCLTVKFLNSENLEVIDTVSLHRKRQLKSNHHPSLPTADSVATVGDDQSGSRSETPLYPVTFAMQQTLRSLWRISSAITSSTSQHKSSVQSNNPAPLSLHTLNVTLRDCNSSCTLQNYTSSPTVSSSTKPFPLTYQSLMAIIWISGAALLIGILLILIKCPCWQQSISGNPVPIRLTANQRLLSDATESDSEDAV